MSYTGNGGRLSAEQRQDLFDNVMEINDRSSQKKNNNYSKKPKPKKKPLFDRIMSCLLTPPDAPYTPVKVFGRGKFDLSLLFVTLVLVVFGLIMMGSASYAISLNEDSDSFSYMFQQIVGAVLGLGAMIFLSMMDYHFLTYPLIKTPGWKKTATVENVKKNGKRVKKYIPSNGNGITMAHLFFLFACLLMALVFFMGESVSDAKRWITIAGIRFQPSEIYKIAVIILCAYMIQRNYDKRQHGWHGFLKYILFLFAPTAAFCVVQRHLSALIIICAIIYLMMFVGQCNGKGLVGILLLGIVGVIVIANVWDYVAVRIDSWKDPFNEATVGDGTYQTAQSLITIGSGGWTGLGLGNSIQKYHYLPESPNDFIFAIIVEELGFIGGIVVILLFVLFGIRGFFIAGNAKDKFGCMLAVGITVHLCLQAMLNIGVACNAIPNTGVSLPFFSYGRTALILQLAEVGILLSVSRDSKT